MNFKCVENVTFDIICKEVSNALQSDLHSYCYKDFPYIPRSREKWTWMLTVLMHWHNNDEN